MRQFDNQGITLVEVLVGVSILAIIAVAIGISINTYVDFRSRLLTEAKTTYLAEEGYEILRAIRDDDWNTIDGLTVDTTQYLEVTSSAIGVTTTPEVIDTDYARSFVVRDLYRDSDDDVVASTTSGAVIDSDSREVEVTVVGPDDTVIFYSILSNVHNI